MFINDIDVNSLNIFLLNKNKTSPNPLTPSEIARQSKNATRQLAMEW